MKYSKLIRFKSITCSDKEKAEDYCLFAAPVPGGWMVEYSWMHTQHEDLFFVPDPTHSWIPKGARYLAMDWDDISYDSGPIWERIKTPQGWVVRSMDDVYGGGTKSKAVYIHDENHTWVEDEPQ
jgi:hypothetical protein